MGIHILSLLLTWESWDQSQSLGSVAPLTPDISLAPVYDFIFLVDAKTFSQFLVFHALEILIDLFTLMKWVVLSVVYLFIPVYELMFTDPRAWMWRISLSLRI